MQVRCCRSAVTIGAEFIGFFTACPGDQAILSHVLSAVTPIGMRQSTVPIMMSDRIAALRPDFFFLGAGEVDLKVGCTSLNGSGPCLVR